MGNLCVEFFLQVQSVRSGVKGPLPSAFLACFLVSGAGGFGNLGIAGMPVVITV